MVGAAKTEELLAAIRKLARQELSIAEINRRAGELAWERGLTKPSYARVRQLVNDERDRFHEPSWGEVVIDVATRTRPPDAVLEKLAHAYPIDEDAGLRSRSRRS